MRNADVDHATEPLLPPQAAERWIEKLPRPVAVTGGTGFVGSHLVETLCAAGVEPRVLVRAPASPRWIAGRPVEWVPGSLEDQASLDRLVHGARTIFHLAGLVRASSGAEFDRSNHLGTRRLAEACRTAAPEARLVHVSSLAAVGPSVDPAGVAPGDPPRPVSSYGRSKLAAEEAIRDLDGETRWSVVRPPAVYGPRDTDVFEFFRMASAGLVVIPGGERFLTVAYVADVVRGVLAAAAGAPHRTYHLGERQPIAMADLVHGLAEAGGVRARLLRVPGPVVALAGALGGVMWTLGWRRTALTPDKAREIAARHWTARTGGSLDELGISDVTPFREGARATWAWYRRQGWLG